MPSFSCPDYQHAVRFVEASMGLFTSHTLPRILVIRPTDTLKGCLGGPFAH